MQHPTIVEKPELLIVGYEARFIHALSRDSNGPAVIGPLWDRLINNVAGVPNRQGNAMYGVVYPLPESGRSHPDELQYVAGVAVSRKPELPEEMVLHTVGAGTFAVFTHRGPIAKIADTCRDIYRDWLPQSSYAHNGTSDVELYDDRFRGDSDDSVMEYWVPVRPRTSEDG